MSSDLYGKTTESLESLNNVSCATRVTCVGGSSRKKKVQPDIELDTKGDEEAETLMAVNAEGDANAPKKSRFKMAAIRVNNARKFVENTTISKEDKRLLLQQRRHKHLSKFGTIKKDQEISTFTRASASSSTSGTTEPDVVPRLKRPSAAKVLYKAGANKLNTKPRSNVPTWEAYGVRSFLHKDLTDTDEVDGPKQMEDHYFFGFDNERMMRGEPEDLTPRSDGRKVVEEDVVEEDVVVAETAEETFASAFATVDMSRAMSVRSRGAKINTPVKQRQKKKSKIAWLSGLLGKTYKKGIASELKDQQEETCREYFTVWLSFVQIVIMIIVLAIYPFAPIGKDVEKVKREVLLSRNGVLMRETLQRSVVESFWIGPSLESLILLGAKYAPCMRRDRRVYEAITKERFMENSTGCCMQNTMDGCIQRSQKECMSSSTTFKPNSVCGEDPQFCMLARTPPSTWNKSNIIEWPICEKKKAEPADRKDYPHMACEVTGHPCCISTQGQCVITSQDNCKFRNGIYHQDANLCSQVDCLSATCGNSFTTDDYPDQFYRLFIALFLNAGILHLLITLIFNATVLRSIEGYQGWLRTAFIFLCSGGGGYLWSSLLIPYEPEVGESGAMFGIFACIFVEGIQNWSLLVDPWKYMFKLTGILFVLLLFGLLPYIDNYAHIFGFVYGIFIGFVVMPVVYTSKDEEKMKKEKRNHIILSVISMVIVCMLTVLGFVLFYVNQNVQSNAIGYFNCPLGEKFCQRFHQGLALEDRNIEY